MLTQRIGAPRLVAGLAALCLGGPALAQPASQYPVKPIRFIVGFEPGGGTDINARTVGDALSRRLGQTVIVDNRPAAGGVLARRVTAEAAPDGYTLLMLSGSQVIGATLVHKEPIDMRKTFRSVSQITTQPYLLTTNPSFQATNVKEIIAYARSKPGAMNYGSTGMGSMAHLATELFKDMAQIQMVHVPYKGSSPGLLDLVRGQIQFLFASATASLSHAKAGRLRLIAASSKERSRQLPTVPTIDESGLPGFDVSGWYAIIAPARTPAPIVQRLNAEIGEVLKLDTVRERMAADGTEARHSTPEQLTELVDAESRRWTALVKRTGLQLN